MPIPTLQGFGQGRIHNAPEEGCILPRLVMQGKNQGAEPHQKFAYPRITLSEPRFQIFTDLPGKRRAGAACGKGDGDIPLFDKGGYDKGTVLRGIGAVTEDAAFRAGPRHGIIGLPVAGGGKNQGAPLHIGRCKGAFRKTDAFIFKQHLKICIRFSQVNDVKPFNRAFEQGSYLAATDGARADYKAALPRKFQKNWIVMHKASDRVVTENIFVTYELSNIARPRPFVHRWGNGGFRVPFVRCVRMEGR